MVVTGDQNYNCYGDFPFLIKERMQYAGACLGGGVLKKACDK